jgi:hypothetical protein
LTRNNVPFDVAHALVESGPIGEAQALAYTIVFSRFESGAEFDWDAMRWKERG